MYTVDERDVVKKLHGVPECDAGAPTPVVLASELAVFVTYDRPYPARGDVFVEFPEPRALVHFYGARSHRFGPPNDEAFAGHPLASRGLKPYGAFEVLESSWIRQLEAMNSVHERHVGGWLQHLRHFVLTFHDRTFECVAVDFEARNLAGPLGRIIAELAPLLE